MVDLMRLRLGDRIVCGGMESKVTSLATMIGDTILVNGWQYLRDGASVTGSRRPITAIHAADQAADGDTRFSADLASQRIGQLLGLSVPTMDVACEMLTIIATSSEPDDIDAAAGTLVELIRSPGAAIQSGDKWVHFGDVSVKRFKQDGGDQVVAVTESRNVVVFGKCHKHSWAETLYCRNLTTEQIDEDYAAYARHLEPKPVLVWDESLPTLPRATHGDGVYVITFIGNLLCDAWFHFPGGADCTCQKVSIEDAKQACERHARGE